MLYTSEKKSAASCLQAILIFISVVTALAVLYIFIRIFIAGMFTGLSSDMTNRIDEAEFKMGAKKAVSLLNQAMTLNIALENKTIKGMHDSQLADYFASRMNVVQNISPNKFATADGMTYEFFGNGSCTKGCYVKVDTNSDKGPNKIWQKGESPSDIVIIPLTLQMAEFIDQIKEP